MNVQPVYILRATAIVGCGISLFFCFLSMVAFLWFRPRTESIMIKKHLTVALASTQIIFLTSIEGYQSREGCLVLSVLLHFAGSACFSWCAIDALGLYFFHANTSPAIRNANFYIVMGWGLPIFVVVLTMMIGFLDTTSSKTISLYSCWASDNVIWAFILSSVVIATVNVAILLVILKQLRQPSYDISPKAAIEKHGTRYGLRTNSLMLLGLFIGWIFTVLSFTGESNLRYQLTFGLINGLQGIFLFFFHCLLNSDHVKGYSSGSRRGLEESGRSPTSDSIRSKRQEFQSGSNKSRSSNRSSGKMENVPLISVSTSIKMEEKSPESTAEQQQRNLPLVESDNIQLLEKDSQCQQRTVDVIPQLPGIPDASVNNLIDENKKGRKSSSEPEISTDHCAKSKGKDRSGGRKTHSECNPEGKQKRNPKTNTSANELESLFSGTECLVKPHCSSLTSSPKKERGTSIEETSSIASGSKSKENPNG